MPKSKNNPPASEIKYLLLEEKIDIESFPCFGALVMLQINLGGELELI